MEDLKIIKDMRFYISKVSKELYSKNNWTKEKIQKHITMTYEFELAVNGYIKFENENDLFENKFFILFYNHMSEKYKKLIKNSIKSLSYRANNKVRGFRGGEKNFDIEILQNFYGYDKINFALEEYLQNKKYFENHRDYKFNELIACELMDNKKVLELLKKMIYDNDNVQHISRELIIGAIESNNKEAINAIFDLLKAAKLSEGLRSSIVNFIDYGSIETYKLFLDYIRSENLLRFSSVKEAFVLFTGINYLGTSNEKGAEYLLECLLDNKTIEYLKSENPLKVFIALYSLACEDINKALNYIYENYKSVNPIVRNSFICFLKRSDEIVDSKIITYCLKNETDHSIKAGILSNLPKVSFENNQEKKDYILVVLKNIKEIKPKTKYFLFDEENKSELRVTTLYCDILEYVEEVDDLYEEAYELFGRYSLFRSIYRLDKGKYRYLNELRHPAQKKGLIRGLSSSLTDVRRDCYEILINLKVKFTEEDYFQLAKELKSKRSDLRSNICNLFKSAEPNVILNVSKYLINQKKDELKSGGLSILVDNLKKIQSLEEFKEIQNSVKEINFAHEVEVLKDTILMNSKEQDNKEDVTITFDTPTLTWDNELVNKVINYDFSLMKSLMIKWYDIFMSHKDEEVVVFDWNESKITKIIGMDILYMTTARYGVVEDDKTFQDTIELKEYERYYFYKDFLNEINNITMSELALLHYVYKLIYDYKSAVENQESSYPREYDGIVIKQYDFYMKKRIIPDIKEIFNEIKDKKMLDKFSNFGGVLNLLMFYCSEELNVIVKETEEYNKIMLNHLGYTTEYWKNNVDDLPEYFDYEYNKKLKKPVLKSDDVLNRLVYFDDNYAVNVLKNLLSFFDKEYSPVDSYVYFYFLEKGLISRQFLVSKLLCTNFNIGYNSVITNISKVLCYGKKEDRYNVYRHALPYYDLMKDVYIEVVGKMLEVELKRTDSETIYTKSLHFLNEFYGVDVFAKVLDKMKKIDFVRGYNYGGSSEIGIKDIFSEILANTLPEDTLIEEQFNLTIKNNKIADKKLLEAGLYNPYFTKFIASYLNIKGLEKAMYYFKAHSLDYAENILDETRKMIKRYSEFEIEDFVDGKMDIKWFREIQEELSKEDYEKVYDASKYIMNTSKRKRGQYFADAVLGKLDIIEVEEKIKDKRNQDMLLCFGLIPLGKGEEKEIEAVRRYKRLQQFLKESKQFGAQRRATETRRSNISISNLATNYGLEVNRFVWVMEARLIDEVKDVFQPKVIEEIEVYLSLENVEKPEVIIYKAGKKLKSIPSKYKKDEHIIKINEVKKDIKNQYSRARLTLENSMCNSDVFKIEELRLIISHPIVKEIVKNVLFISDGFIGFIKNDKLLNYKGEEYTLTDKSKVRIAHCVDLYENNWAQWQQYIMENKIVQPFKQVFRELYTLTDEEISYDGYTNRFAGYQINSKKAMGILSRRNWLLNDQDGFEKVNHIHNLRIDLYCYANLRNANLLEEETIEKVVFINNKTNKTMDMKKLDRILFSETMRDLDLVVSVAYVGGVDPLLNHTTLEMRKRILEHNLNLFKVKNFEIKEKYVLINGSLGKYSIHLGSGVVSVEGKGMLPMTPVHSQRRGHIFLPFVDEDPKTAEIVSKVLMLAEDNKLKDPTILQFLK